MSHSTSSSFPPFKINEKLTSRKHLIIVFIELRCISTHDTIFNVFNLFFDCLTLTCEGSAANDIWINLNDKEESGNVTLDIPKTKMSLEKNNNVFEIQMGRGGWGLRTNVRKNESTSWLSEFGKG